MGADNGPYIADNIWLYIAMSGNGGNQIRHRIRGIGMRKGKAKLRVSGLAL